MLSLCRQKHATKILAVRMLQGYKPSSEKCSNCDVPLMMFKGTTSCVVCPTITIHESKKAGEGFDIEVVRKPVERDSNVEDRDDASIAELSVRTTPINAAPIRDYEVITPCHSMAQRGREQEQQIQAIDTKSQKNARFFAAIQEMAQKAKMAVNSKDSCQQDIDHTDSNNSKSLDESNQPSVETEVTKNTMLFKKVPERVRVVSAEEILEDLSVASPRHTLSPSTVQPDYEDKRNLLKTSDCSTKSLSKEAAPKQVDRAAEFPADEAVLDDIVECPIDKCPAQLDEDKLEQSEPEVKSTSGIPSVNIETKDDLTTETKDELTIETNNAVTASGNDHSTRPTALIQPRDSPRVSRIKLSINNLVRQDHSTQMMPARKVYFPTWDRKKNSIASQGVSVGDDASIRDDNQTIVQGEAVEAVDTVTDQDDQEEKRNESEHEACKQVIAQVSSEKIANTKDSTSSTINEKEDYISVGASADDLQRWRSANTRQSKTNEAPGACDTFIPFDEKKTAAIQCSKEFKSSLPFDETQPTEAKASLTEKQEDGKSEEMSLKDTQSNKGSEKNTADRNVSEDIEEDNYISNSAPTRVNLEEKGSDTEKSIAKTESHNANTMNNNEIESDKSTLSKIAPSVCSQSLVSLSSKVERQTRRIAELEAEARRKHEEAELASKRAREAFEQMINARAKRQGSTSGKPSRLSNKPESADLSMCSTLSEKSDLDNSIGESQQCSRYSSRKSYGGRAERTDVEQLSTVLSTGSTLSDGETTAREMESLASQSAGNRSCLRSSSYSRASSSFGGHTGYSSHASQSSKSSVDSEGSNTNEQATLSTSNSSKFANIRSTSSSSRFNDRHVFERSRSRTDVRRSINESKVDSSLRVRQQSLSPSLPTAEEESGRFSEASTRYEISNSIPRRRPQQPIVLSSSLNRSTPEKIHREEHLHETARFSASNNNGTNVAAQATTRLRPNILLPSLMSPLAARGSSHEKTSCSNHRSHSASPRNCHSRSETRETGIRNDATSSATGQMRPNLLAPYSPRQSTLSESSPRHSKGFLSPEDPLRMGHNQFGKSPEKRTKTRRPILARHQYTPESVVEQRIRDNTFRANAALPRDRVRSTPEKVLVDINTDQMMYAPYGQSLTPKSTHEQERFQFRYATDSQLVTRNFDSISLAQQTTSRERMALQYEDKSASQPRRFNFSGPAGDNSIRRTWERDRPSMRRYNSDSGADASNNNSKSYSRVSFLNCYDRSSQYTVSRNDITSFR